MKKYLLSGIALFLFAGAVVVAINATLNSRSNMSSIALENVEVLTRENGTTVTSCLGLWDSCTTSSGASSKAPLVEVNF
ncbi:MAG: hypothetical protein LBK58_01370 [Prevotellaceae bacterium]|jgi:hypothetical protein|nr:hypothetical protein [Prevotellaceae bacterium]